MANTDKGAGNAVLVAVRDLVAYAEREGLIGSEDRPMRIDRSTFVRLLEWMLASPQLTGRIRS